MAMLAKSLDIDSVEYRQMIKIKYKSHAYGEHHTTTETKSLRKNVPRFIKSKFKIIHGSKYRSMFPEIMKKLLLTGNNGRFATYNGFVSSEECENDRLAFNGID